MKNTTLFLLAITLIITINQRIFAQQHCQAKIDSVLLEIPKANNDTNLVNLHTNLAFKYYAINPDEDIKYR